MLGGLPGSQTCLAATVYRNKSSARGPSHCSTARRPPGTPCLAPQPHAKQKGCPASTQQCLQCQGSHNMVDDLYHALLPAILLCCFFSFFLYLLPKIHFLLTISLSPSLSPAAESIPRLGQSHPNTIPWMYILQVSHIVSEWNKKQLYTRTTASTQELSLRL